MEYKLVNSNKQDIPKLIQYKLNTLLNSSNNLTKDEMKKIKDFVKNSVPKRIKSYKNIVANNEIIGCVLIYPKDNGLLLDEIYIEEKYQNNGIGTNIIKTILNTNEIIYLWVYKSNIKAIKLYQKLGFKIIEETETRYYMKYSIN